MISMLKLNYILKKYYLIQERYCVCNNMFEPCNPGKYFNFFKNPYLIVVWRDPKGYICFNKKSLMIIMFLILRAKKSIDRHHKSLL